MFEKITKNLATSAGELNIEGELASNQVSAMREERLAQAEQAHATNNSKEIIDPAIISTLVKLANDLKKRHYMVTLDNDVYYSASYLGDVLLFATRMLHEMMEAGELRTQIGMQWQQEQLPITQQVSIEIGPKQLSLYMKKATSLDPLGQLTLSHAEMAALEALILN